MKILFIAWLLNATTVHHNLDMVKCSIGPFSEDQIYQYLMKKKIHIAPEIKVGLAAILVIQQIVEGNVVWIPSDIEGMCGQMI